MTLAIDIGNTAVKAGVFRGTEMLEALITPHGDWEGLRRLVKQYHPKRVVLGAVGKIDNSLKQLLEELNLPATWIDGSMPTPVINTYRTPHTLGIDRLAAVVAARDEQPGRNVLVIDVGTCITYDLLLADGRYMGGNISPGRQMRLEALHRQTAKLPLVSADGELLDMGADTHTAIRAGVEHGIRLEMEGYIRELSARYPDLLIFLTGGRADSLVGLFNFIIFADRFLVVKGLNSIFNYNNGCH